MFFFSLFEIFIFKLNLLPILEPCIYVFLNYCLCIHFESIFSARILPENENFQDYFGCTAVVRFSTLLVLKLAYVL